MTDRSHDVSRRGFLTTVGASGALGFAATGVADDETTAESADHGVVRPGGEHRILLSCKLGMIPGKLDGKPLSLVDRLNLAGDAGFDGVDFDQAGSHTPEEARAAVAESGVFVHNAINHAHWGKRLTSANEADRNQGRANIEHCMRVSHAAGGVGVLIVVGRGTDGTPDEVDQRAKAEIRRLLPLAAALGQPILIENVWNQMHYEHGKPPEQPATPFVEFVDSFTSPWVGMYYDIGNHWKYGQPDEWIREFGHRCVKLDVKGFSREAGKFTEIGEGDLPWDRVRKALDEIGFTGWATAEVGGGGLDRLKKVREQMQRALHG